MFINAIVYVMLTLKKKVRVKDNLYYMHLNMCATLQTHHGITNINSMLHIVCINGTPH
jgi:hypothetical protein